MYELPLFPLNTLLFPSVSIPLHIFEPRYKEMINFCVAEDRPFGIVLIKEGQEGDGTVLTHRVGCSARITYVDALTDGRMNIVVTGQERFEIESVNTEKAYLMAKVKAQPLGNDGSAGIDKNGRLIPQLIDHYINKLKKLGDVQFKREESNDNPVDLAYLGAHLLQLPLPDKQTFLEIDDATALTTKIVAQFKKENIFLDAMIARGNRDEGDIFPFSLN